MKNILNTILLCSFGVAGFAQTTSSVNIIFNGVTRTTNNYEVRIDDRRYFSNTNTNNAANYTIAINNLLTGTRSLRVYRLKNNNPSANANSQNTLIYSNKFILKEGYEMNITVRPNGSVEFSEVMSQLNYPGNSTPMATAAFNSLKQSVQSQWSQTLKAEKIRDAFVNINNHFTSAQVRDLLVMVTSESDRLDLVKLAYAGVTDKSNFAALGNVFSSTTRRNQFADFVQENTDGNASTGTRVLISDSNFNMLVANVKSKWSQSLKGEALRDAFENWNNYFTTGQVRQLMGLVSSESDRMDLIKLAYPTVYDAINYASLYDVFASAANRTEFNDFIVSKGGVIANTTIKTPMSSNDFNYLTRTIQGKSSQSLKSDAIKNAFLNTNNYFSTAQVRQLLSLVSSENDRMNLVKLAYPAVTDATNFATLYDIFMSTANRNEFNDFIISKGGVVVNTGVRVEMSANNFNLLMNNVQGKYSQSLKAETIREAFLNVNNYFSTAQIRNLLALVTSENDRMTLVKLAYPAVTDATNFATLYDIFMSTANRNEFNDFVVSKGGVVVTPGVKVQMTANNFNVLMNSIQGKWSQPLKTDAVRDAFLNTNNYFSTAQIRELLTVVTSERDRLELAKQSFRSVMDPATYYQLSDLFTNSSYQNEFKDYANAQTGSIVNTTIKTPMSDMDFSILVLTVRGHLLQFLKVQAERDVFANPNNSFTTDQIKELISLINSEPNRLELAKLSYKTVTDPENFTQLNDLFQVKANRDELAAYVRDFR